MEVEQAAGRSVEGDNTTQGDSLETRLPTSLAGPVVTGPTGTVLPSLLGHPLCTVFASVGLSPDLTVSP